MLEKDIITKCVQYAFNVSDVEFADDLSVILENRVVQQYVNDKFDQMRTDFGHFWCSLDEGAKQRFVDVVKQHYGIA